MGEVEMVVVVAGGMEEEVETERVAMEVEGTGMVVAADEATPETVVAPDPEATPEARETGALTGERGALLKERKGVPRGGRGAVRGSSAGAGPGLKLWNQRGAII